MKRRERWIALLFVAPATLLIGLFVLWPAVGMIRTSLLEIGLTQRGPAAFGGLGNYRVLFDDPEFLRSARNTAWFTVLVVPLQTALALFLAVWTNGPGMARRAARLAAFVPTVISLTVLSVLWKLLYEPATATGSGLINGLLGGLHLPTQPFLTSPRQAMLCIVAMSIWQGVGLQMMIFISGLQGIPDVLYEASVLDGAGRWRQFLHVTLPGIAPMAVFVVMITTIFALKLFVQPFLMTRGGPEGSTVSVVQYIYQLAFFERDLGLACAAGVVFLVAVCAIALLQRWASLSVENLQ